MRLTSLLTVALAAGIGLSACSTGGSQAVPGSTQTAPMAKPGGPRLVAIGAHPDASCPSQYITCVSITRTSHRKVQVCVQYSYCPAPGEWTWSSQVRVVKTGKAVGAITSSASPNPGNPTVFTISEKRRVKSSNHVYKYQDVIEACSYTSNCVSGAIGIATK